MGYLLNSNVMMIQTTAFPIAIASSPLCLWRCSAPTDGFAPWQSRSQTLRLWSQFLGFPVSCPSQLTSASTPPSEQHSTLAPL
jgi:hypothetical protein